MQRHMIEHSQLRLHLGTILAMLALAGSTHGQAPCPSAHAEAWRHRDVSADSRAFGSVTAINDVGDRAAASGNYVHQGLQTGAVWLIANRGTPNQHATKLIPSVVYDYMSFGLSLAMDGAGELLIAGAPSPGPSGPPRAFVYRYDGANWNEELMFIGTPSDWLGATAAIARDGSVFAVGAPMRLQGLTVTTGAIEVFRRQAGAWNHEATVIPTDVVLNHRIGNSIALSGDGRFLAGRTFVSANSPVPNGAVYVFEHVAGNWVQAAKLQEPVAYSSGGFGMALAFDHTGSVLAAGNFQDSRLANTQGAVSIFRRVGTAWSFETALLPTSPLPGTVFGQSVALNQAGDRLLVGAPGSGFAGVGTGAVEEFEFVGGTWNQVRTHVSPTPQFAAGFGRRSALACNATGSVWIAGEPQADTHSVDAGQVHVFRASCLDAVTYCTAQTNTLGCVPQIGAQGTPSASSTSGFRISVRNVRNQQNGMLLYGTNGRASIPWLGGTLCVQPPLRRTPLLNSSGSPAPANDCSGVLLRDFNAWTFAAADPALFAGQHVRAQFYSRDPGAVQNLNLSDALEFYLEP